MNQIYLTHRNAVVTGGARGIGRAIARRMRLSGANVMIWDSDLTALEGLRSEESELKARQVDVTDEADVIDAAQSALQELGRIDILVNAAGIAGGRKRLIDLPLGEWEEVLQVNLTGTFLCCREVVRTMVSIGYGRVVNISSIAGNEAGPLLTLADFQRALLVSAGLMAVGVVWMLRLPADAGAELARKT